jgi:hypothetical protein
MCNNVLKLMFNLDISLEMVKILIVNIYVVLTVMISANQHINKFCLTFLRGSVFFFFFLTNSNSELFEDGGGSKTASTECVLNVFLAIPTPPKAKVQRCLFKSIKFFC